MINCWKSVVLKKEKKYIYEKIGKNWINKTRITLIELKTKGAQILKEFCVYKWRNFFQIFSEMSGMRVCVYCHHLIEMQASQDRWIYSSWAKLKKGVALEQLHFAKFLNEFVALQLLGYPFRLTKKEHVHFWTALNRSRKKTKFAEIKELRIEIEKFT